MDRCTPALIVLALAAAFASPVRAADPPAQADDYAVMLRYLTHNRIDGQALSGASGAIAVNLASGDLNQQANLRAFAIGDRAAAGAQSLQLRANDHATAPDVADASIGDGAFAGAHGLVSINQASGAGNAELNAVTAALAQQGIREAGDDWIAAASASTGGNGSPAPPAGAGKERSVAVEASAMKGLNGVVQLNQVAGSGNAVDNQLRMSVSSQPPR